jgi:hypothetical protein
MILTTIHSRARPGTAAVMATLATAAMIAIATDVVPNPWFARQIPVRTSDVVVLAALSVLTGALAATYTLAGHSGPSTPRNKIVVRLLGHPGATSWFEPLQPALVAAAAPARGRRTGDTPPHDQKRRVPAADLSGALRMSRARPRPRDKGRWKA